MKSYRALTSVFAVCLTSLTAAAGCSGNAADATEASEDALTPTPQLKQLIGFDYARAEVADFCVDAPPFTMFNNTNGQSMQYSLDLVESKESLMSKLNVDASLQVKWLAGSVDTTFNSDFTKQLDMTHVYALATAVVRNSPQSLDAGARLKQDAADTFTANKEAFYRRCGTHFVDSITTGGSFVALIDIQTSGSTEAQDISAKITGSSFTVSGSAEMKTSLQKAISNKTIRVNIVQQGGVGESASFVGSVDKLLQRLDQFSTTVQNNPVAVDFTLKSYDRIGLPSDGKTNATVMLQRQTQKILTDRFTETQDSASAYNAALTRPNDFSPFDRTEITQGANDAAYNLNVLMTAVRACALDPDQCALPSGLKQLPARPVRLSTAPPPPPPPGGTGIEGGGGGSPFSEGVVTIDVLHRLCGGRPGGCAIVRQ